MFKKYKKSIDGKHLTVYVVNIMYITVRLCNQLIFLINFSDRK